MAYVKQTWQTGDTVTSAKLNHMEDGIAAAGGAALVVNCDSETNTLDKTWQEIHDAFIANGVVVADGNFRVSVSVVLTAHGQYLVGTSNSRLYPERSYLATSANGYPSYTED